MALSFNDSNILILTPKTHSICVRNKDTDYAIGSFSYILT